MIYDAPLQTRRFRRHGHGTSVAPRPVALQITRRAAGCRCRRLPQRSMPKTKRSVKAYAIGPYKKKTGKVAINGKQVTFDGEKGRIVLQKDHYDKKDGKPFSQSFGRPFKFAFAHFAKPPTCVICHDLIPGAKKNSTKKNPIPLGWNVFPDV